MPLLRNLKKLELEKIADALHEIQLEAGDSVVTQGEVGDAMYILKSGACQATISGVADPVMSYSKSGDFFGELALLTGAKRGASVKVRPVAMPRPTECRCLLPPPHRALLQGIAQAWCSAARTPQLGNCHLSGSRATAVRQL